MSTFVYVTINGHVMLEYGLLLFPLDEETLVITHEKLCEYTHLGIGGRDASILATMMKEGISGLMTHDQAFKLIPDIEIFDPI